MSYHEAKAYRDIVLKEKAIDSSVHSRGSVSVRSRSHHNEGLLTIHDSHHSDDRGSTQQEMHRDSLEV